MCRLLYIRSERPFELNVPLEKFARIAKNSKEYQGHGWGCAYLQDGRWSVYKSLTPVWNDTNAPQTETTVLLAHARSAFRDQDIAIENNMPFFREDLIFIFNGELHGVKIKEAGRIGAEKIFNFILRFYKHDLLTAMQRSLPIVESRSRYLRAMNLILADKQQAYVSTHFNDDEAYFTMHYKRQSDAITVCSEPFPAESGWQAIENRTMRVF
jgi:glutamine amidotransferase